MGIHDPLYKRNQGSCKHPKGLPCTDCGKLHGEFSAEITIRASECDAWVDENVDKFRNMNRVSDLELKKALSLAFFAGWKAARENP